MKLDVDIPPGVTLYAQDYSPEQARFGDLWTTDSRLFRRTLGPACSECHRPGPPMWEEIPAGLASIAHTEESG